MRQITFRVTQRAAAVVVALAAAAVTVRAEDVPTVLVRDKRKQEKVVIDPEVTRNLARLNERFAGIAKLWESRELETARVEYRKLLAMSNAPAHYRSYAHLRIAQSYAAEQNTAAAQAEYEKIKTQAEYPPVHRYEAEEILKEIDRVAKGLPARDVMASRTKVAPINKYAVEYFVAPAGNDADPGTREQPFASLEKARDAIRALKAKGALPGPVGVRLLPGEYPMTRTLELTAVDSGTEAAPIVYRADQKGTAVLYGGTRLSGWTAVNDPAILERLPEEGKAKVFQCDLKKLGITDFGRITVTGYGKPRQPDVFLYCNGRKQPLARWPNSGYVEVKRVIQPGSVKSNIQPVFEYADKRHARWTKAEDPWLYSFLVFNWVPRRIPIRHIDTRAKTIAIDPYGHADRDGIGTVPWQKVLPYFALNMLEEIDSPGEWYLDRGKGVLYLYPQGHPDSSVVELGMLSQVMVSMDKVSHVRMEHLKWDLSRGDCMTMRSCSNILLAGCSLSRFAMGGIDVQDGRAVGIFGCDVTDIAGPAVRMNGGDRQRLIPAGNFIENCLFARLAGTAVGINGVGNRVAHNRFEDIEDSAVYGIGGLLGNDHVIEYNDVIRCGLPLDKHPGAAGDMGVMGSYGDPTYRAIYRYNRFSEIGVNLDGGHAAIRLDDAISGMVIYGNVFDRCGDNLNPKGGMGALNYNAGRDNICDNNLFIRCPKVQTGGFNPNNDCWERILKKGTMTDPLYLSRYPDLKNYLKDGVVNTSGFNHLWRNIIVDCPVIVRPGFGAPLESFDLMDLAVYANQDPGFVAMVKGDYRLVKDAPVLNRIGFRPIPVEEIGLYEDEYRASWPVATRGPTVGKTWRIEQRDGRYCLLRPDGKPLMILGLSHASGAWQSNDGKLTPDEKAVRLATLKKDLRDLHFNAVGYVPELVSEFAYIHNADRLLGSPGMVTGKGQTVSKNQHLYQDVFDPAFKARLKTQIQNICAKTARDANCIGYWWTDIPVWRIERQKQMFGKSYVDFIRDLPEATPGRIRYEQHKRENGGGDDAGFLVLIARELYTATAESYRQFAPGRLLFGERYNTIPGAPLEIIAECGKVVDVVSFQPYEKTLSGEMLDKVHAMTGKPIMLSDWNLSFPVGSYTNTMWPQFPNESTAAKGCEAYLVSAFAKPYILGYYKCQYRDAVLAGSQLKPGLRDQDGKLYGDWAQSIARIHQSLLAKFEKEGRATGSP